MEWRDYLKPHGTLDELTALGAKLAETERERDRLDRAGALLGRECAVAVEDVRELRAELAAALKERDEALKLAAFRHEETVDWVARQAETAAALAAAKERERAAVQKCIEVVLNTPVQLSDTGHAVHDHGQNTLLMAAARIRAAFPESSQP